MAKPRMDLTAFVGKLLEEQDGDVLREGIRVLSQALMETEVAGPDRRGAPRAHGGADRVSATAAGCGRGTRGWARSSWRSRRCGRGRTFPSLLQPRRRAEHALLAVVQEAYVHGVSTRKVDDLVKALGVDGISKSEVSRICGELDTVVTAFRTRALTGEHRYLWVDATYHKVRVDGRVISQATVVAVGVTSEGERQVLGVDVGPSEDRRVLDGVSAEPGEARPEGRAPGDLRCPRGLKQAISTVLTGATWQRCRVHFMRNLLATVPQGAREAIAAIVRTIFAQPDHASALTQLRKVADGLRPVSAGRGAARRRRRRHPGVPAPADRASAPAAQHESARAPEQGDQAPLERRRDLSESGGGDPLGRRGAARAGRRMGRGRAPLFQRGVDEAADDAVAVDDHAGDLGSDCVRRDDRCGRLWKTALWFSKRRWTVLFPSTAAAASTPFTDSRMTCANFHHLTGHYLLELARFSRGY